ncbi:MAG TPA: apolipoprotein N-acyltransferase [Gammaproteobacteria bacterium]|nr:apolipoprotein N-acyltransferase [Gammaproteobacteria bacterium]
MSRAAESARRLSAVAAALRAGVRGDLLAACAGALLVLAFAPFDCYPLAVIAPALLLWLIGPVGWKRATWRGFLFGFAEFALGVHWIYISLHGMGGVDAPIAVIMLILLVAVMGAYSAAACALAAGLAADGWRRRLLLFPAAWVLTEWVRSWFLTGFPWLNLGVSQVDGPLRGYAPLLGGFGVSLCVMLSAGLLLGVLVAPRRRRALALAGFVALWGGGALLAAVRWTHPAGPEFRVSLVQGNIAQDEKWEPEYFGPTLEMYRDLTAENWKSRLVVWPEAAVPAYEDEVKEDFLDPLETEARKRGTDILMGIPTYEPAGDAYYNSVISLGSSDGVYDKRHLVPFGENFEFLPGWVRSLLRSMDLPYSSFSPGAAHQPLLKAAGYPVGVSICSEDAYGDEIMQDLPEAAYLVNVSNDGWFGKSIALPQHLEVSRMVALEAGRDLLRTTNTGITAIVDDAGRIIGSAPAGERSVLSGDIVPLAGATPVSRWGNWPVLLLSLLLVVACAWRKRLAL